MEEFLVSKGKRYEEFNKVRNLYMYMIKKG